MEFKKIKQKLKNQVSVKFKQKISVNKINSLNL